MEVFGSKFRDGQKLHKPYRLCVLSEQPHGLENVASDQWPLSWSLGINGLANMRSMQGSSENGYTQLAVRHTTELMALMCIQNSKQLQFSHGGDNRAQRNVNNVARERKRCGRTRGKGGVEICDKGNLGHACGEDSFQRSRISAIDFWALESVKRYWLILAPVEKCFRFELELSISSRSSEGSLRDPLRTSDSPT